MMMAGAVGRPVTEAHAAWLLRQGLLPQRALARYEAYALPDLIAHAYPRVAGEARGLLVDTLGWFTILDDHFDGPAGRDLRGSRDLVRRLLDTLEDPDDDQGVRPPVRRGPHPAGPEQDRRPGPCPGGDTDRGRARDRPPTADRERDRPGNRGRDRHPGRYLERPPYPERGAAQDRAPEAPAPGAPACLLSAWQDLWRRQCAGMPEAWARRAGRDWARCLTTFVTEAQHRAAATLPTVRQAVHLRRHASCLYPFMNMLERVRGEALDEALHAEREMRLLRAHVADTATLINDLYSLDREERHASPFNMIVILGREQRLSRAAAVEAVRAEVDRLGVRSDTLRASLAARHPEAAWYVRETRTLVEGVRRWSSTTDRYTDTSL
ncbi:hypothetical protein AB0910_24270 [Streptomyces sp. NPDC047002]|uniref:terpene synthase family protein n=1 Tax=Streptomyces sp. NPDC047002 TaxID=3155475 RepID=UPI003454FE6F